MTLTADQERAIAERCTVRIPTARDCAGGLEAHLHTAHPVLDHGFVRVVDYMGGDSAIVQAARVSYGTGTRSARNDEGLIRYLMRHQHTTPFEMCEIKLHVKLPVFVARQWVRHRTANVNEYSARYSILDREFYVPEPDKLAAQSATNAQGRGAVLQGDEAERVLRILQDDAARCYANYERMLNQRDGQTADADRQGLTRELARINLPLGVYTQWYWKIDLHNLLHFLALRADSHAQYEIRAYADVIGTLVEAWVPAAWRAFEDFRLHARTFSRPAMAVLRKLLAGETVGQEDSGLSPGEWREFRLALED